MKLLNWCLIGFGALLCIGGGIAIMVLLDILNTSYSDPSVLAAAGSVALGVGFIALQFAWNPGKWTD